LIGAGSSILGNIRIGDGAKIGAGSVVLKSIPPGATAVGAPAKIIGRVKQGDNPAASMEESFQNVELLHKSSSLQTLSTTAESSSSSSSSSGRNHGLGSSTSSLDSNEGGHQTTDDAAHVCPYREYRRISTLAPKDSITICSLYKLLLKEGVPEDVVGCIFFALDTKNVGYVHCTLENCERLIQLLKEECTAAAKEWTLEEETKICKVVEAYRVKHHDKAAVAAH
jgi:hypothetical protein